LGLSQPRRRRDPPAVSSARNPQNPRALSIAFQLAVEFSFFPFLSCLDLDRDLEHHEEGSKRDQTSAEEVSEHHRGRHGSEGGNWLDCKPNEAACPAPSPRRASPTAIARSRLRRHQYASAPLARWRKNRLFRADNDPFGTPGERYVEVLSVHRCRIQDHRNIGLKPL
jgi:hypothetical protein